MWQKKRKNWLVHVVWSLKVRIVLELTKAPNFLQLIAYCSSMNIRRGAQCRYSWTWHLVLPETRMTEGGNEKYHDSQEEVFILQNIADLKAIRYKVFTFDFGFKLSRDFTNPGRFIFLVHASALVERSLNLFMKSDWRASVDESNKTINNFSDYLVMSIHIQWKRLGLRLPHLWGHCGGGGRGGEGHLENCAYLWKHPCYALVHCSQRSHIPM